MHTDKHRLTIAEAENGGLTLEVDGHDLTAATRAVQVTVDDHGNAHAIIETNPMIPLVDTLADLEIRPAMAAASWLASVDPDQVRRRVPPTGMASDPVDQIIQALTTLAAEACA